MSLPILYSFKRCPYAIRARMALAFAQIDHIHREIDLKNKHPIFLETSPKGTVPVLVNKDEDLLLDESYDIVYHALSQRQPDHWAPINVLDHKDSLDWLDELQTSFIPAVRRIKYAMPPDSINQADQIQANAFLKKLNIILRSQNTLYKNPSIIDILLFPNIRQLTIHDPTWTKKYALSGVERWISFWCNHQVFKKIFVTQPVWDEQQTPIEILHDKD